VASDPVFYSPGEGLELSRGLSPLSRTPTENGIAIVSALARGFLTFSFFMKNRAISLIRSLIPSSLRLRKVAIAAAAASATLGLGAVAIAAIVSGASTTGASNHVTYTQLTLNVPTESAGDVMIASLAIKGGTATVMVTVPTGWTQIARTDNDTNVTLISYYKIASASEPSSYTWTIQDQTRAEGGITDYGGVDTTGSPIVAFSGNTGRGKFATTSPIVTGSGAQVIALFATEVGTTSTSGYFLAPTTTSMTQKYNVSNAALGPSIAEFDASKASGGSTGSIASATSDNKTRDWAAQEIVLSSGPTTDPMTVSSSTLALWSMNGSAGTSAKEADDGPSGLNLVEVSSPASGTGWTTPSSDGAYVLDGTNYLSASDTGMPSGNSAYTVEAWVYLPTLTAADDFNLLHWGTRDNAELVQMDIITSAEGGDAAGRLHWGSFGENHESTGRITAGTWHYIAETYDGTTVHFYIDGNDAGGSFSPTNTPNVTLSGNTYIGTVDVDTMAEAYIGNIDQLKISNRAKSATEINNYYHGI
jgi:hypothetical protein